MREGNIEKMHIYGPKVQKSLIYVTYYCPYTKTKDVGTKFKYQLTLRSNQI
jgi:hypothetical protein